MPRRTRPRSSKRFRPRTSVSSQICRSLIRWRVCQASRRSEFGAARSKFRSVVLAQISHWRCGMAAKWSPPVTIAASSLTNSHPNWWRKGLSTRHLTRRWPQPVLRARLICAPFVHWTTVIAASTCPASMSSMTMISRTLISTRMAIACLPRSSIRTRPAMSGGRWR